MNSLTTEILNLNPAHPDEWTFFTLRDGSVSAAQGEAAAARKGGDEAARTALNLAAQPTRFLSTVQIGITLIGILSGAFGGATIAETLAAYFAQVPRAATVQ